MSTSSAAVTRRKPGPKPLYGVKAGDMHIYAAPELRDRVEREVRYLNDRDETNTWALSRVVVDILYGYFEMPNPRRSGGSDGA